MFIVPWYTFSPLKSAYLFNKDNTKPEHGPVLPGTEGYIILTFTLFTNGVCLSPAVLCMEQMAGDCKMANSNTEYMARNGYVGSRWAVT